MTENKYNKETYFEYDFYIEKHLIPIYDNDKNFLLLINETEDYIHSSISFIKDIDGTRLRIKNFAYIFEFKGNSVYILDPHRDE